MSKYNTCEKEHQDIYGFFAALAEASDELLGTDKLRPTFQPEHLTTIVPLVGHLAVNLQVLKQRTGGF